MALLFLILTIDSTTHLTGSDSVSILDRPLSDCLLTTQFAS